jgi:hypothetical protein
MDTRQNETRDESLDLIKAIYANLKLAQLLIIDLICIACMYIPVYLYKFIDMGQYRIADLFCMSMFDAALSVMPIVFLCVYIYHFAVYIKRGLKIAALNLPIYIANFLIVSFIIIINVPPA